MPQNKRTEKRMESVEEFYDLLAPSYDAMTSFETRFDHERPLFKALIDKFHIRSALDAGCGSGFHSILLSQLGVEVLGVDISSEMLRLAEENAKVATVAIRTLQGSFENLSDLIKERFDSVFVLGNSLPHFLDPSLLSKALQNFAAILDPHGLLVAQTLNYERIAATRDHILNERKTGNRKFVRSYEYDEAGIIFNIGIHEKQDMNSEDRVQTIRLRPVLRVEIVRLLEQVGFSEINLFGGISLVPFDPVNSKDLVILARK
jgi:ubiquinone/menaquinone biosynthesis C-methylase UbiE